jgi:hypothetical protein
VPEPSSQPSSSQPSSPQPQADRTAAVLAAAVAHRDILTARPGLSGTVELVIPDAPSGETRITALVEDGRVVAAERATPVAGTGAAELVLTLPAAAVSAVAVGSLEPSVAYMRGEMKAAGDNRLLLGILAASADPAFAAWRARLTEG